MIQTEEVLKVQLSTHDELCQDDYIENNECEGFDAHQTPSLCSPSV